MDQREGNQLTLSQEKFNADGSSEPAGSYHWKVPINILTAKGKVHKFLLEEKSMTVTLDDLASGEWFKVNAGFIGYYRLVGSLYSRITM